MNPSYLWITGALELMALFVAAPVLAIAIAWGAWKGKLKAFSTKQCAAVWIASFVVTALLFGVANWINADVRTPQYFLQLACFLFGCLSAGVFMGCGCVVLLSSWRWHRRTRLTGNPIRE